MNPLDIQPHALFTFGAIIVVMLLVCIAIHYHDIRNKP